VVIVWGVVKALMTLIFTNSIKYQRHSFEWRLFYLKNIVRAKKLCGTALASHSSTVIFLLALIFGRKEEILVLGLFIALSIFYFIY
jgi:hypothetical protein